MEMNVLLSDMIEFVPPTVGVIVAALIAAFFAICLGLRKWFRDRFLQFVAKRHQRA